MNTIRIKQQDSYVIGASVDFSDQQVDYLIRLFKMPTHTPDTVLGGRSSVTTATISGMEPVVVKRYTRGGVLRHLVKKKYLKWGKTRCQKEYELLEKVRHLGVNTPEPVAFAFRGRLIYEGWLVTKEIRKHRTLAGLSLDDENHAERIMARVTDQVAILINNCIFHVDFHPGNVLINDKDDVFFLDFDKGKNWSGGKEKLKDRYIARWNRSITKHNLPEILSQKMEESLSK